jgi:4-hydroxybenzoate polyprenyltransferase
MRWHPAADLMAVIDAVAAHPNWPGVVGLAILFVAAARGLYVLNRRQRRALADRKAQIHRLPEQYRFRAEPLWFRLVGLGCSVGALTAGALIAGQTGAVVGFGVAVIPFWRVAERHRRKHQQEIIDEVRRDASSMSTAELTDLVRTLELAHGRYEMRPLRHLIPHITRD